MISQKKGQTVVGVPQLSVSAAVSTMLLHYLLQGRFSCNLLERKNMRQTWKDDQWPVQTVQGSSNPLFIFPCLYLERTLENLVSYNIFSHTLPLHFSNSFKVTDKFSKVRMKS